MKKLTRSRALSRRSLLGTISLAYLPGAFARPSHSAYAKAEAEGIVGGVLKNLYHIVADTVITDDLFLFPGAQFHIEQGVTLTIKGDFMAPLSRVFTGEGKADLLQSPLRSAKPEWWGAVANNFSVDCGPAIAACLNAHIAMEFGPGDYFVPDGIIIDQHNRRIFGTGRTKDFGSTRLVKAGPDGPVAIIGTKTNPGSINDYVKGVEISRIEFSRTKAGSAPRLGRSTAIGLKISYVLDCRFENLRSNEHSIGYEITNAVRTIAEDCVAFRSITSGTAKQDMFIGFEIHDNASLYLKDCNVSMGGDGHFEPLIGARLSGNIADSFLVRFETRAMRTGILIDGKSLDRSDVAHQINVHIDTPVLDQCFEYGLHLSKLSAKASLDITNPYVAAAHGDGTAIQIADCRGSLDISGGQIAATTPLRQSDTQYGASIVRSSGVRIRGLKIMQFPHPFTVSNSSFVDTELSIIQMDRTIEFSASASAIAIADSQAINMRPTIRGKPASFQNAVLISGQSERIKIDATGIDGKALSDENIARFNGSVLQPDAHNMLMIP
ncbi:hypothetical protein ACFOWX_01910 [Sphingorhabdus arenilitoris]|uniref:Right-handed parallel beta-helix repeat-containing protein n=1 Tax=Sphingorhabdus arenilitoris TaxID=1490041 RepID=A0ABV8RCV1_9SPHN